MTMILKPRDFISRFRHRQPQITVQVTLMETHQR